jgi:hypothetical protein
VPQRDTELLVEEGVKAVLGPNNFLRSDLAVSVVKSGGVKK